MPKESAEEKLMKMMQKPSSSADLKSSVAGPSKKKFKFTFSITALNTILFLGILGCLIALGFEISWGFSLLNQAVRFPREQRPEASLSQIALPSVPNLDFYMQQINERNIFNPYVPKTQQVVVQGLAQQMAKYKLVGIAWLDLPETATVMIENTQDNKTYFLKQGEQLDGVTVKTIYTDRVVFSHENEETTIKL